MSIVKSVNANLAGVPGGDPWAVYDMVIDATTTAPTKHTSPAVDLASFKVVDGDTMVLQYQYRGAGAGAAAGTGVYLFPLPSGWVINEDLLDLLADETREPVVGSGAARQPGVTAFGLLVCVWDESHLFLCLNESAGDRIGSGTAPMDASDGAERAAYSFTATIPVVRA